MKPAAKLALALAGVGAAAAVFDRLESGRGMRRQLWGLNQRHALEFERKLKARKLPAVDPRILGSAKDSLPPPADISPPGKSIRYTLDGSIPDWHSDVYVKP
ncbi:MAG TPA: chitobiase/beta-hexosaminidase C-terminal domain-containing protein, partial [Geothrix sp.]|nr:chitobiase/beta-hexosaminidase C-terminal domain-containing protein [Geothrix sp.]